MPSAGATIDVVIMGQHLNAQLTEPSGDQGTWYAHIPEIGEVKIAPNGKVMIYSDESQIWNQVGWVLGRDPADKMSKTAGDVPEFREEEATDADGSERLAMYVGGERVAYVNYETTWDGGEEPEGTYEFVPWPPTPDRPDSYTSPLAIGWGSYKFTPADPDHWRVPAGEPLFLNSLEVPEQYRRKGYATMLIDELLRRKGITKDQLSGEFNDPNWPDGGQFWQQFFGDQRVGAVDRNSSTWFNKESNEQQDRQAPEEAEEDDQWSCEYLDAQASGDAARSARHVIAQVPDWAQDLWWPSGEDATSIWYSVVPPREHAPIEMSGAPGVWQGQIGNVQMALHYGQYQNIHDLAAALINKIQRLQAAPTANKRTGSFTGLMFLEQNGYDTAPISADPAALQEYIRIVNGLSDADDYRTEEAELSQFLAQHTVPQPEMEESAEPNNWWEGLSYGEPGQTPTPKTSVLLRLYDISDYSLGFETYAKFVLQADWNDVMAKAKRLIQEGKVTVLHNTKAHVMAQVMGDGSDNDGEPDMHEVEFSREDPNSNVITQSVCDCAYNQYRWDRTRPWKKFEGRPCHLPGSIVTMADGSYRPIEDVKIGERVVTHDGVGTVTDTMARPYVGDVYEIRRTGYPHPLRVTENHEIWAVKTPGAIRDKPYNQGSEFKIYAKGLDLEQTPEWVDAKHLRKHDWVASSFITDEQAGPSLEMATVLGYYLAEGNLVSKNGRRTEVQWTLHVDEHEELAELKQALAHRGKNVRVYTRPATNGMSIRVYDPELAQWLERIGGHLSNEKQLAPEVMLWSSETLRAMLDAYVKSDGDLKADGRQAVNTASNGLARQIYDIVVKCGFIPSWTVQRQKGGPTNRELECWINRIQWKWSDRGRGNGRMRVGDRYLSKIKSIKTEHYEGLVYNLAVGAQESYVTEGVTNHNCSHILATYWKSKSTPQDVEDQAPGYQVPVGQKGPLAPPGQMKIPGTEPSVTKKDLGFGPGAFGPDGQEGAQPPPVPSTQQIGIPGAPQNPFAPPKNPGGGPRPTQAPQTPQREQLDLFNISPEPSTTPPNPAVSVPGATPPTPENPVQLPGTFSSMGGGWYRMRFASVDDEMLQHFIAQQANGDPIYVATTKPQTLEFRGGKQPMPGAQPYDVSTEGVPLYKMLELGYNPETDRRESADVNALSGAPEWRGQYGDVPTNRRGEVRDFDPHLGWAKVHIPLHYPGGEDARLHPHSLAGWVPMNELRVVHPPRTPFRRR